LWPHALHAVLALPDPRKGEQLVLLTTQRSAEARALLAQAREQSIPETAVPRTLHIVEKLPLLGTGKVDYPAAQSLLAGLLAPARKATGASPVGIQRAG